MHPKSMHESDHHGMAYQKKRKHWLTQLFD
jgi:hypothetical protein